MHAKTARNNYCAQVYVRCFGVEIYGSLRRLKAELDPKGLLNRGSVFA